jgi:hypothetical protein
MFEGFLSSIVSRLGTVRSVWGCGVCLKEGHLVQKLGLIDKQTGLTVSISMAMLSFPYGSADDSSNEEKNTAGAYR